MKIELIFLIGFISFVSCFGNYTHLTLGCEILAKMNQDFPFKNDWVNCTQTINQKSFLLGSFFGYLFGTDTDFGLFMFDFAKAHPQYITQDFNSTSFTLGCLARMAIESVSAHPFSFSTGFTNSTIDIDTYELAIQLPEIITLPNIPNGLINFVVAVSQSYYQTLSFWWGGSEWDSTTLLNVTTQASIEFPVYVQNLTKEIPYYKTNMIQEDYCSRGNFDATLNDVKKEFAWGINAAFDLFNIANNVNSDSFSCPTGTLFCRSINFRYYVESLFYSNHGSIC
ncbi:hypothetical protein M0811_09180 [Anaeramoeba ignava]|uniref:Uncharacterized protein n=1 Tax=Anaeramoeba ignava TaxID=1746090 RepID=A0A9Q0LGM9_ANAIG|nr:hypothetical protein M0811_09180 [Anaeramoeba ignava]